MASTERSTYTIRSIKGTETVEGTRQEAISAALSHEARLQPAYGTTVENVWGEQVAGVEGEAVNLGDQDEQAERARAIAVRIMQGRPLCAECVEIRRGARHQANKRRRAERKTEERVQAIERLVAAPAAQAPRPPVEPASRPDCGLADKLGLEAGNYIEIDHSGEPPGCLRVHDACEDIEEEPVDAYLPFDGAAGLRRIARWLSAWADELDARAHEVQ